MSSKHVIGNEGSVAEQTHEHAGEVEGEVEVDGETPKLRPSVEQEIQATVDYSDERDLKGRLFGQTLEAEERMEAREWEIQRTRVRWDRRQQSDREARTRMAVDEVATRRRVEFERRAASVDRWQDPENADPREQLSRRALAEVNRQSMRLSQKLDGWSRAAISRRLAERVVDGTDVAGAVVETAEEIRMAEGTVVPIDSVGRVRRREVTIEGTVEVLWKPSSAAIQQVGLVEDETGRIKVTVWKKSGQPWMEVGERVRIRGAAKSWYEGRVSVAVTGWSEIVFPDRGQWWTG